jgi:hypothetical protein
MTVPVSRRQFATTLGVGILLPGAVMADDPKPEVPKPEAPKPSGPTESAFERDYPAPKFQPAWKKPQINRVLAQDFVIYAHSDLAMVKKLVEKEPALLNAAVDWGAGDWETALGGASHLGNREIALYLIERGARMDIFACAMLGQLEVVKALLTLQPKLIDAKGPHGFGLHWHANMGGKDSAKTLEYLQSVKAVELPSFPMKK